MNPRAVFGINILASLVASVVAGWLLVWPWLQSVGFQVALLSLVAPHLFLRFIGLSFLVPGVASASLPKSWSQPAAYGDAVAGILAIIAVIALTQAAPWALIAVWFFNVWGTVDLLYAMYNGPRINLDPGWLGAGYYIVTAIAPPLLVTHALIFILLIRGSS